MPAYEIPNLRFSAESGAAVARRRFVKIDANEKGVQAAANTDAIVGASSQPTEKAGEVLEIYDGIVMVEAGAAITAGSAVMSDAQGRAVPFTAGSGALQAGVAMTNAGGAGELVSIKI